MINRLLIRSSDTVATKIKFFNDNLFAAARGLYMDRVYIKKCGKGNLILRLAV